MGTYIYRPTSVFQNIISAGNWARTPGGATTNVALLSGANSTTGNPAVTYNAGGVALTGTLLFLGDFFLDGSIIPTPFASLPAGFRVLTSTFIVRAGSNINNFPSTSFFVTGAGDIERQWTSPPQGTLLYSKTFSPPQSALLINTFIGIRVSKLAPEGEGSFYDFNVNGNYDILAFTYTMDPPSGSSVEAGPEGDLITISSILSDPNHLKLNHLTISVACGPITIVTQTETLFTFYLPEACSGAGSTSIVATGDGTQFSGSVPLGSLVILLTDHSGIYTLVPGKSNDTLYSSLRDGTTRDVKIPNPFIKTGFIGG